MSSLIERRRKELNTTKVTVIKMEELQIPRQLAAAAAAMNGGAKTSYVLLHSHCFTKYTAVPFSIVPHMHYQTEIDSSLDRLFYCSYNDASTIE
jgi:hypothetical protein